jgi:hypothetical protein
MNEKNIHAVGSVLFKQKLKKKLKNIIQTVYNKNKI